MRFIRKQRRPTDGANGSYSLSTSPKLPFRTRPALVILDCAHSGHPTVSVAVQQQSFSIGLRRLRASNQKPFGHTRRPLVTVDQPRKPVDSQGIAATTASASKSAAI